MERRQIVVLLHLSSSPISVIDLTIRAHSPFEPDLAVPVPNSNQLFRLRRHNGKSHQHTNHLEDETFYDFHIYMATERYQEAGMREDAYALPTTRYGDFQGALRCLIEDTGVVAPPDDQPTLFEDL